MTRHASSRSGWTSRLLGDQRRPCLRHRLPLQRRQRRFVDVLVLAIHDTQVRGISGDLGAQRIPRRSLAFDDGSRVWRSASSNNASSSWPCAARRRRSPIFDPVVHLFQTAVPREFAAEMRDGSAPGYLIPCVDHQRAEFQRGQVRLVFQHVHSEVDTANRQRQFRLEAE